MTRILERATGDGCLLSRDLIDDFPLLRGATVSACGQPLHYLDNAATTHKPEVVIEALSSCYREHYGSVHRGLYPLAEQATERYEQARAGVASFIGAPSANQLVFTHSATESINLVAQGWARPRLRPGDQIWVTRLEHHANFLPWQRVCQDTGAELRIIEIDRDGSLNLDAAEEIFGRRTRLIALCQVSNVLGIENPVALIVARANAQGIPVLIDAAQSVGHMPVDVTRLDCDFLVFSAHKMYGPNGIGALYAKAERLEEMEPLLLGGGMVDWVGEQSATWAEYPARFEAGSPNLANAIGFAAAADYLAKIGMTAVQAHVGALTRQAVRELSEIPGLCVLPSTKIRRSGVLSFELEGVHPHDVAQIAAESGVALRAGHHCCQPLMQHLGLTATTRVSFGLYNHRGDLQALLETIASACRQFR